MKNVYEVLRQKELELARLEKEVEAARIYAGFHYRHSLVQGFVLGHHVANQVNVRFFQPSSKHHKHHK